VPCQTATIQSVKTLICIPGERYTCTYSGDVATLNKGLCQAGTNYCNAEGTARLGCMGEVVPQMETCDKSVFDEDCDGMANEAGTVCNCTAGKIKVGDCYTASQATKDIGVCKAGTSTCNKAGTGYTCKNEVVPVREECTTLADDDCNGSPYCSFLSKRFGDVNEQTVAATAFTMTGDMVVGGSFKGSLTFGSTVLTNPSTSKAEGYIAMVPSTGTVGWAKRFGGGAHTEVQGIARDSMGNFVVVGRCSGMVDFGSGTAVNCPGMAIFVVTLDKNGNLLPGGKQFPAGGSADPTAVALDTAGNILLAGSFRYGLIGPLNFGGGDLYSADPNAEDVFVAKLTSSGAHVWAKIYGDAAYQDARGIAIDSDQNVAIIGDFEGSLNFSGVAGDLLTSAGMRDIFVAKLSGMDGSHVWSKRYGDSSNQGGKAIAVDVTKDIVVTGDFMGAVNFSGTAPDELTSGGDFDIFVAKLGATDGVHRWSKRFGGALPDSGLGVTVTGSNQIALTGYANGTLNLGKGSVVSIGQDMFVAKLEPLAPGNVIWAELVRNAGDQNGSAIAIDGMGNMTIAGTTTGAVVDWGNGPLFGAVSTNKDIFFVKLAP
jgi:hypothetical protein